MDYSRGKKRGKARAWKGHGGTVFLGNIACDEGLKRVPLKGGKKREKHILSTMRSGRRQGKGIEGRNSPSLSLCGDT